MPVPSIKESEKTAHPEGTEVYSGLPGSRARVTRARERCNTKRPSVPSGPAENRVSWFLRPDQPEWVRTGILAWLETGDPLHLCFGLGRAEYCRAARDHYLCAAWLVTSPGHSPWHRALSLADAVRVFARRVWPRARKLAAPDPGWSTQREALWRAFRSAGSIDVPESPEMIKQIIKLAGLYRSDSRMDNDSENDHS